MMCIQFITFVLAADDVVGTLEGTLRGTNEPGSVVEETALGDVIADAVRATTGADLAIIPGGIIYYNLQGGDITRDDLISVFSDDQQIVLVKMSATQLWELMEIGISHITVGEGDRIDAAASVFDGFPQISGFYLNYDASAPSFERLMMISLADGSKLEQESDISFFVAMTCQMADGSYGYPIYTYEATEETVSTCMIAYFTDAEISVPDTDRINYIGVMDNALISQIPLGTWILICIVICVCFAIFKRRSWDEEVEFIPKELHLN